MDKLSEVCGLEHECGDLVAVHPGCKRAYQQRRAVVVCPSCDTDTYARTLDRAERSAPRAYLWRWHRRWNCCWRCLRGIEDTQTQEDEKCGRCRKLRAVHELCVLGNRISDAGRICKHCFCEAGNLEEWVRTVEWEPSLEWKEQVRTRPPGRKRGAGVAGAVALDAAIGRLQRRPVASGAAGGSALPPLAARAGAAAAGAGAAMLRPVASGAWSVFTWPAHTAAAVGARLGDAFAEHRRHQRQELLSQLRVALADLASGRADSTARLEGVLGRATARQDHLLVAEARHMLDDAIAAPGRVLHYGELVRTRRLYFGVF